MAKAKTLVEVTPESLVKRYNELAADLHAVIGQMYQLSVDTPGPGPKFGLGGIIVSDGMPITRLVSIQSQVVWGPARLVD